jgi:hypothetical protein
MDWSFLNDAARIEHIIARRAMLHVDDEHGAIERTIRYFIEYCADRVSKSAHVTGSSVI